jgi:hypothetical protein
LNSAWASADKTQNQMNRIANTAVDKILSQDHYSGTDANQKPCQVNVERYNWGTKVYVALSGIPFFLSIDPQEASTLIFKQADQLKVITQYKANDYDESSDDFMITDTLTVSEKQGKISSIEVQTYDSGIDVNQNAVCNIRS